MNKRVGIGVERFSDLIHNNCYYIDKTQYIKFILESESDVLLIARPRRFGKTLFLDTIKSFLEIDKNNPGNNQKQKKLFSGLTISSEVDFCSKVMGQHPVLSLSLKEVKGENFEHALKGLADTLQPIAENFSYLLNSPALTLDDKIFLQNCQYRQYLLDLSHQPDLEVFLAKMARILFRHYRRQVVLLLDEYDVPLQKAYIGGYYEKMLTFMQAFLSPLKSGSSPEIDGVRATSKAILSGCLTASKASIFTDINNFVVNSVCTQGGPLSTAIGFTPEEVETLLNHYDLNDQSEVVRSWYDGYRIGGKDIYCPWDVIHFCSDIISDGIDPAKFNPQNYWIETSSNRVVDEFLGSLTGKEAESMQTLMDGGEIEFVLNEQVDYHAIADCDPDDFWTLLLFAGYLTMVSMKNTTCRVKIPNEEIREAFGKRIQKRFSSRNKKFLLDGEEMARAALRGSAEELKIVLTRVLRNYVSIRNTATRAPAENYYHSFLNALLAGAEKNGTISNLHSNSEAGDGDADLLFTAEDETVGVIIELKHCSPNEKLNSAKAALAQIQAKHYVQGLLDCRCRIIFGIGIAFSGKTCAVEVGELDPQAG